MIRVVPPREASSSVPRGSSWACRHQRPERMTKPMPQDRLRPFNKSNKSNPQKKFQKENSTVRSVTKPAKLSITSSTSWKAKLVQILHRPQHLSPEWTRGMTELERPPLVTKEAERRQGLCRWARPVPGDSPGRERAQRDSGPGNFERELEILTQFLARSWAGGVAKRSWDRPAKDQSSINRSEAHF